MRTLIIGIVHTMYGMQSATTVARPGRVSGWTLYSHSLPADIFFRQCPAKSSYDNSQLCNVIIQRSRSPHLAITAQKDGGYWWLGRVRYFDRWPFEGTLQFTGYLVICLRWYRWCALLSCRFWFWIIHSTNVVFKLLLLESQIACLTALSSATHNRITVNDQVKCINWSTYFNTSNVAKSKVKVKNVQAARRVRFSKSGQPRSYI